MDKVTKEFLNLGWELKPEQRRELDKLVHIVRKQTLKEVLKEVKGQCGCGVESKYCSHYEFRKWLEQKLRELSKDG